jgi:hypothetical protein
MVRLVFRPYTQVRRSICTLESLRASTRVSPGFTLLRHSSPSFGSRQVCSHSNLSPEGSWSVVVAVFSRGSHITTQKLQQPPLLSFRALGFAQSTRTHVRLLGPCFKTGCRKAFRQDLLLTSIWVATAMQRLGVSRYARLCRNAKPILARVSDTRDPERRSLYTYTHTAFLLFHFSKFRHF